MSLNSEIKTTEYTEHTENQRVGKVSDSTQKMSGANNITHSFSVYFVYSVVRNLPF